MSEAVVPEFPFYIEEIDTWVHLDPECEFPGEVRYMSGGFENEDGAATIYLREYDERVLFHECLHVVFWEQREARQRLGALGEEGIVREITRGLYAMGWRWRETDRTLAQIERELNTVAGHRDAAHAALREAIARLEELKVQADAKIGEWTNVLEMPW